MSDNPLREALGLGGNPPRVELGLGGNPAREELGRWCEVLGMRLGVEAPRVGPSYLDPSTSHLLPYSPRSGFSIPMGITHERFS